MYQIDNRELKPAKIETTQEGWREIVNYNEWWQYVN